MSQGRGRGLVFGPGMSSSTHKLCTNLPLVLKLILNRNTGNCHFLGQKQLDIDSFLWFNPSILSNVNCWLYSIYLEYIRIYRHSHVMTI